MGQGTLTIYSASAGSGKTFRLAGIYLSGLFKARYDYRKILAVTFTNKATAEMKGRILEQLHWLATGRKSEYLPDLIKETGKNEELIRKEAGEILFSILHDYSRFSVSTIDSFFQKVLRAFSRESDLHSGFGIELDHSIILAEAIDKMIADAAEDTVSGRWLNEFVISNLEEEKNWNLKDEIRKLAEELFKEKFKILSEEERLRLEDKDFLLRYIDDLKSMVSSFRSGLIARGKKCLELVGLYELTDDMFYFKGNGIPGYIRAVSQGIVKEPGVNVRKINDDPPRWSKDKPCRQLQDAIDGGLDTELRETISYYYNNVVSFNSAQAILQNIFSLGILSDVQKNVREIAASGNIFLLSDAGEFLSLITGGDQAPFIYEKIGNRYENYMIDEFQDTSLLQWKNFEHLVSDSMGEGHDNLVVGDVKQSIYRFRNSDWQILGRMKDEMVDNRRIFSEPLKTNWRSRSNVIRFNNALFSAIPDQIDRTEMSEAAPFKFTSLYSEAVQIDPGTKAGGYVRLEFIDDESGTDAETNEDTDADPNHNISGASENLNKTGTWRDIVIERLPAVIEAFQDHGYAASDIGILVRDSKDGSDVLNRMTAYSNTCSPKKKLKYNYNIISNDSLILSKSPVIIFLISLLKVLNDPEDMISRALMKRFYLLSRGEKNTEEISLFREGLSEGNDSCLPEGYELFLKRAGQMPLAEATESIIDFFGLGGFPWNVPYLSAFQDCVINFSGSRNADLQSFLEWWESKGGSKSVTLTAGHDAATVITVHKSKGLEFKVVILPFLSWNLDHKNQHHPILWIRPESPPFDSLGIVPVRYGKELENTLFAKDYRSERHSVYLDNINLLYVAMTRGIDAVWGFLPAKPGAGNGIVKIVKEALVSEINLAGEAGMILNSCFNSDTNIFESGSIPYVEREAAESSEILALKYVVSPRPESLKLKLHGENYFTDDREAVSQKISYGNLMHEVFEGIESVNDISSSVRRLITEGKISESEYESFTARLESLLRDPEVYEWFRPGNKVLNEAGLLLPSGIIRRPDRVIIKENEVIVIDFKFGEEKTNYSTQVRQYCSILQEMGYSPAEGYLWYVDKNKIVRV